MTDWRKVFRQVAPHADPHIMAGVLATIDDVLVKYRLTTVARQADFLAHVLVESKGLQRLDEDMNYRAAQIRKTWPTRFASVAAAEPYAHNPKALAIKVYGSRMGNRAGTDDGWNNRGSGALQITGAANLAEGAERFGISVAAYAEGLRDPDHTMEYAAEHYVHCGAVRYADRGDITGSTKCVNGGDIGLTQRRQFRDKLRVVIPQATKAAAAVGFMSMPADDEGAAKVRAAQERLKALGYFPGMIDGVIGPTMQGAISTFQSANHLTISGELDDDTVEALGSAMTPQRPISDARANATVDDLRDQGSKTIEAADEAEGSLKTKMAAGVVAAGGLSETVSQANAVKDTVSQLPDLAQFALSHALLIAVVVVGIIIWLERKAIKEAIDRIREARVEDHRTGANLGR